MVPETAGIKRFGTRIISLILVIGILLSFATPAFAAVTSETVWVLDSQKPTWLKDSDITGNKWKYTKKTNKNSTDPTMSGYTLASSCWIQDTTGSAKYAAFPSGFDKTNSIYTSFKNQSACPYTAYEETTKKRTVSVADSGYVYWHWMYDCGGASGTSTRAIYNKKGTASKDSGGTGFYYKYFGAFTSTEGNYDSSTGYCNSLGIRNYIVTGRSKYADCQGATRWFRFAYKTATYTDYHKRFTFTKTENLESSTAVTEGTTTSGSDDTLTITTISDVKHYVSYTEYKDTLAEPVWSAPADKYKKINDSDTEIKVLKGTAISLSCTSPGAEIFYILSTASTETNTYSGAITVNSSLSISYYSKRYGVNSQQKTLKITAVDNLTDPPTINTPVAENITFSSAVLKATVTSEEPYELSFTYWPEGGSEKIVNAASGSSQVTVSNLSPNTKYSFTATAKNSGGTVISRQNTFTTTKRTVSLESNVTIVIGRTRPLKPTISPAGDSADISWSSDNSAIAAVSQDGTVTAAGIGTTTIRATLSPEGVPAECVVTVVYADELVDPYWTAAPDGEYRKISENEIRVLRGTEISLSCESQGAEISYYLVYDNYVDPTQSVIHEYYDWPSPYSTQTYAKPIHPYKDCEIFYWSMRGKEQSQTMRLDVNVVPGLADKPDISALYANEVSATTAVLSASVNSEEAYELSFTYWPEGGSKTPVSAVNGLNSVTVSGLIPDTDYFYNATATNSGGTAYSRLNTFRTQVGRTVSLDDSVTINLGSAKTLFPDISLEGNSDGLEWSSDDSNIAEVTQGGVVTAAGIGTTTIRATLSPEGVSAECVVTVVYADELVDPVWSAPDDDDDKDKYRKISEKENEDVIKVLRGTEITLSCKSIGAEIKYMLDYDTIAGYKAYSAPIPVGNDLTLYYYSTRSGENSQVKKLTVTVVDALADPPKISALHTVVVDATTAVLSAEVIADGDYELWFRYCPQGGNDVKVKGSSGSDSVTVSGLMPNTEYYFTAEAKNEGGWDQGYPSKFRTPEANGYVNRTVELNTSYVSIRLGRTVTLFPSIYPGGDSEGLVWKSYDEHVATVSSDGTITAVGTGTTRVRATLARERVSAYCVVEVFSEGNANITYTENLDFSELNMITNSSNYYGENEGIPYGEPYGFDTGWKKGGNALMATAYLARWDGAVSEKSDPYPQSGEADDIIFNEIPSEYHVQKVLFLPYRNDRNDNYEIKNAIANYGAVYSAFLYNENNYHAPEAEYYKRESTRVSGDRNHAVVIVGWNDDYTFDAKKYYNGDEQKAKDDKGAFICKNSKGDNWGDNGYFYISYSDAYLGRENCNDYNAVFCSAESNQNYDKIYQHDYFGPVATGTAQSSEAYLCNVFPGGSKKLASDEVLRAVSFYVYAPNTHYRIYVVPDYKDSSSLSKAVHETASEEDNAAYAGYMTVNLSNPVSLSAGSSFAVIVVLESIDGEVNYFVEAPKAGYSSKASASDGESFIYDGNENKWIDYQNVLDGANLCIKAFTDVPYQTMSVNPAGEIAEEKEVEHVVYTASELISMGYDTTEETAKLFSEDDSESYGQITPAVFFDGSSTNISEVTSLNRTYSLRTESYVSSVKHQGAIGSCWAFAALASLESCTIKAAAQTESYNDGLSQAGTADRIVLSPSSYMILPVGGSKQIIARVEPLGNTENIYWSSSDSSVASVSPWGIVTALKEGTCVINAETKAGDRSASIRITVMQADPLAELTITNTKVTYKAGELFLVDYSVSPANAQIDGVIFGSSDETIATVDEYGLVTALRQGTVTIFVSHEDPESGKVISAEKVMTITDDALLSANIKDNNLVISAEGILNGNLLVSLEGTAGTENAGILVAGFYCDGKFLHMDILPASLEGRTKCDYSFDIFGLNLTDISDSDAIEVRVFAVESLETMIPVSGVDSCFVAIPNKDAEATE